ncbi:MAG: TetR family transcriptional regulator [Frankiales bacterium]|nr:TetR family transcriptional regulator [Frankiales bacterium]
MTTMGALERRPKRADARRNYDKLIEAARAAFTENGAEASLEDIARRAEVGIGTLYRHFPTRQDLLEATYVEEVEALCASADALTELDPWDALVGWLQRFAEYASTKKALSAELLATLGMESEIFATCHNVIFAAGEPLLKRAQASGAVRPDVTFSDAVRLVSGISMVRFAEPEQIKHVLAVAMDGLRYRPEPPR